VRAEQQMLKLFPRRFPVPRRNQSHTPPRFQLLSSTPVRTTMGLFDRFGRSRSRKPGEQGEPVAEATDTARKQRSGGRNASGRHLHPFSNGGLKRHAQLFNTDTAISSSKRAGCRRGFLCEVFCHPRAGPTWAWVGEMKSRDQNRHPDFRARVVQRARSARHVKAKSRS